MEVKTIIGSKYEVIEILKQSENSQVGICINKYLGNEWLVKFVPKGDQTNHYEIDHLLMLNHPRIPKVIDKLNDEEGCYYILEKLRGIKLEAYFMLEKMTIHQLIKQLKELSKILEHVHCMGIVHGDIKPDNILIDEQVGLALIDFGSSFTHRDSMSFTQDYVAPERLLDTFKADDRSDIYSVGMVIKEGLSHIKKRYVHPIENVKVKKLMKLAKKCTQCHPDQRVSSTTDLYEALHRISPKK